MKSFVVINRHRQSNVFLFYLLMVVFAGCTGDEITFDPDNLLTGRWNYSTNDEDTHTYLRSEEFIEDHCYQFNSDGTMTERKISGWCATPPLYYENFQGTWTAINDTLIQIDVGYWAGTTSYKIDIELLSPRFLKIKLVWPNTK